VSGSVAGSQAGFPTLFAADGSFGEISFAANELDRTSFCQGQKFRKLSEEPENYSTRIEVPQCG
jgi:hypothetical protein